VLESPEKYRQRVGQVDLGVSLDFRSRGQVIRDLVLAVLLVALFVALTFRFAWPSLLHTSITLLAFAVYCTSAYFLRVRPNHDELGAAGGIVDHPFRWSDGTNRFLVQLVVVLALGRFISVGLVDGVRLLTRGELPQDRLMRNLEASTPGDEP